MTSDEIIEQEQERGITIVVRRDIEDCPDCGNPVNTVFCCKEMDE